MGLLTLRDTTYSRVANIGNIAASGVIGTAADTVDNASCAILAQSTATVLLSNPAPTNTSLARNFRWYNGGSVPVWNAYGQYIPVGGFADQTYIPGTGWKGIGTRFPQAIYMSGTAVVFPADTAENNSVFVTIPGGFIGANSMIECRGLIDNTSGTGGKTLKLKFGSMTFSSGGSYLASATANLGFSKSVYMTNSTTAQISTGLTSVTDTGNATSAAVTGTVDTASDVIVRCSITKVTGSDVTTQRFVRVLYTHGS